MNAFLHFLASLTPAQLHAVVAYLQAVAHQGHVGQAVYCGPRNLHNAAHYTGVCR